jgi:hypothetical protein
VLRYLWALPNTLVGLLVALPLVLSGGRARLTGGVLEVHGRLAAYLLRRVVPLEGGAAAITFGHVVIGRDRHALDATRTHELAHVRQCEVWGPLFIPAYLAAALWGYTRHGCAYEHNYFERQARRFDRETQG